MSTYNTVQGLINQATPAPFAGGMNLLPGEKSPKAIACACDFSASGIPSSGYYINPSRYFDSGYILAIQCLYIDNGSNNGYVTVNNPQMGQAFSLPPGYQGYFPCIAAKGATTPFYATSTGTGQATVTLLNVMMPGYTWAATVTPPSVGNPQPVSDAILDACVTANQLAVNVKNTIANPVVVTSTNLPAASINDFAAVNLTDGGGASQIIVAADANRREVRFANTGANPYALGSSALTWAKRTVVVNPGDVWIEDSAANLAWYGICNTGLTAVAQIQGVNA